MTTKDAKAEVLLKVKFNNIAAIINRTRTTIDSNPEILQRLLTKTDNTFGME